MSANESPIVSLNNYLQNKGRVTALTWDNNSAGPRHEVVWTSNCKIDNVVVSTGTGSTKNLAKEAAAREALQILTARDEANAAT